MSVATALLVVAAGYAAVASPADPGRQAPSGPPQLDLVANTLPSAPTALTTTPAVACTTGSARPYLGSTTPKLTAGTSDADGGTLTTTFEWYTVAGVKIGQDSTASAAGATASVAVPSGAFSNAGSYKWRVSSNDGSGTGTWSSWCEFTVDTTAPSAGATVTSSTYPSGAWAGQAGTAGTFYLGAGGITDVASYLYGLDTNPPVTTVNAESLGGSASVSVTPATAGPHTLYVQSVDRAGNKSAVTAYAFNVGSAAVLAPAEGSTTDGLTRLQGSAPSSVTGATFQWRRADTDAWVNIPAADVKTASGNSAVNWPVAVTNGTSTALNWNVRQSLANANSPASIAGRWWLNETSGNTAADSSGKGHDAATYGGVTWSGDHGGSAVLNGDDGYIKTNAPVIDTTGSFTVSAWAYLTDNSDHRVLLSQSGTKQASFAIQYERDAKRWELIRWAQDVNDPTEAYVVDSIGEPKMNTWTHLAATFDITTHTMKLYADGVLQGESEFWNPIAATGSLLIGSAIWNGSPAAFWKGGVADVQAYTSALAAAQIAIIAQGGQAADTSVPLTGPVQVRAVYSGGTSSTSTANHFTFDPARAEANDNTVGPGSVNMLTGNYTVTVTDAEGAPGGLSLTRSFNTRQARASDGANLFGSGWVTGVAVSDATLPYSRLILSGSLAQVFTAGGDSIDFAAATTNATGTTYAESAEADNLRLTYTAASDSFTLQTDGGGKVTFNHLTGTATGFYEPTAFDPASSSLDVTYSWEKATADGATVIRPTRALAPAASGVSCTTLVAGCRALTFGYATTTSATGTAATQWGDYAGRLSSLTLTAYDPDTAAMKNVVLARYSYDNAGRLRAAWDPRLDYVSNGSTLHVATTYGYDTDGILNALAPAGQEAWQFSYTTLPGDLGKGRLAKVTRSALTAGTNTTTIVYRVPASGPGAPYDLSATARAAWGQDEAPVTATAVFDGGQNPTGDQAAGTLPSSYERATVSYLDTAGRTVNLATPGGYLSATWYDVRGNQIRGLTAQNRWRAVSTGGTVAQQAAAAVKLSEIDVYDLASNQLVETLTPEHPVALADGTVVTGRSRTLNAYDEGAPSTGGPFNLVTTVKTGLRYTNAAGAVIDAEVHTTRNSYNWTLGAQTAKATDPDGLNLVESTGYNSAGQVVTQTLPAGSGSTTTASTRTTVYYQAGTGSGYSQCDSKPYWADLPCRVHSGGQAATGPEIPATVTTYDLYGKPRTVQESTSAGTLRTTTTTYDAAGRVATVVIGASAGTAVATTRNVYAASTGSLIRTESLDGSGNVTAQVVRQYDTLGRTTGYTDADGVTTSTTYDLLSRVATVNDGKGTRTFAYDEGGERRSLLTSVTDSQAGKISGEHDADGVLWRENWPNGITFDKDTDEAGNASGVRYIKNGCGLSDCTLYVDYAASNAQDQKQASYSTMSTQTFVYDSAGRMIQDNQVVAGQCASRTFGYNANSNRTELKTYAAASGGGCQTSTASSTRTWTYDTADRITSTGYAYDESGRTTTVPATDTANGTAALTVGYFANDMAKSLTQGSRTASYTLDVLTNRFRAWSDNASGTTTTRTNHYSADNDSPSWVADSAGGYSRTITGLSAVTAQASAAGVTWQVQNLHGDIVATIAPGASTLSTTGDFDAFGQAKNASDIGTRRYGWLGNAQRGADTPGGMLLMGARLYNPTVGRFLSIDSVYGGNANAYDYCNGDPIRCTDTTGLSSSCSWKCDVVVNNGKSWLGFRSVYIARDRCSHIWATPCSSSPKTWLSTGQSSTRYWRDTDAYRVISIWRITLFTSYVSVAPWQWS